MQGSAGRLTGFFVVVTGFFVGLWVGEFEASVVFLRVGRDVIGSGVVVVVVVVVLDVVVRLEDVLVGLGVVVVVVVVVVSGPCVPSSISHLADAGQSQSLAASFQ